jgi:hypothetical protein
LGAEGDDMIRPETIGDATESELRGRLRAIALAEMARQRRRLGALAPEQELALEELLVSTVERIYHPIIERLRVFRVRGEVEQAQAWSSIFG